MLHRDSSLEAGSPPEISVIIPVRNDPDGLHTALSRLVTQVFPANKFEVLIVDDQSENPLQIDGDYPFQYHLIKGDGRGSYAARNKALALATGAVIAFTDADCLPEEQWLKAGQAAIAAGSDIVAGDVEVVVRDPNNPSAVEACELLLAFRQDVNVVQLSYGVTANLFVRKKVFEHAGLFDEQLRSGGDREWCMRAVTAGARIMYSPEAAIAHPARTTYASLKSKMLRTLAGVDYLERTNERFAAQGRSRLARLLHLTLPPLKTVFRLMGDRRLPGFWLKLKTAALLLRLRLAMAVEGWRLYFGGDYKW